MQLVSYPLQFNPYSTQAGAVAASESQDEVDFPGPKLFNAAFLFFISHQEEVLFWCAVGVVALLLVIVVAQIIRELHRYGVMLNR